MKANIAISRQMGSAGSQIGKLIAERLSFKYVDREVLYLAAQEFGIEPEELDARAERVSSFWDKICQTFAIGAPDARYTPPPVRSFSDEELFEKQTEIMKKIAAKSDCVIVGWGGAHVLPYHDRTLTVLCHAPLDFRIERVKEVYQVKDDNEAREMVVESDDMRKNYIAQMTDKDWICAENYDLAVNTSLLPVTEIAEMIIEVIKRKGIVAAI